MLTQYTRPAARCPPADILGGMNHVVAYELLTADLKGFRNLTYDEASQLVGEVSCRLIRGPEGLTISCVSWCGWSAVIVTPR